MEVGVVKTPRHLQCRWGGGVVGKFRLHLPPNDPLQEPKIGQFFAKFAIFVQIFANFLVFFKLLLELTVKKQRFRHF